MEALENRMVLAFTVTGTTAITVTMTNNADTLIAAVWSNPDNGFDYLGLWDETRNFPGDPPNWKSWFPPPATSTLASAITNVSVFALAGNDGVDLQRLTFASFPLLATTSIEGGADADWLIGTFTPDDLRGDGGTDTIFGREGNDVIRGDDENDTIFGGIGQDTLYGGLHNDTIKGEGDRDIIEGNEGDDTIDGGSGDDEIRGNDGEDTIDGGSGPDTIYGGSQNDTIRGGDENDRLDGNAGNDTIHGGLGADDIRGNDGDDILYGDEEADLIYGGANNDRIFGGTDGDILNGEAGDDWIEGGAGNDTINGGNDKDILWSNVGPATDQPWNGVGEIAAWNDMAGTGPATDGACDLEDNHPEATCGTGGPTPVDDGYAVGHNAQLDQLRIYAPGVLGNDGPISGDGSSLTVGEIFPPAHAETFIVYTDGGFKYNPVNTFVGTDYFYYRTVQSGIASKRLGIVTMTVTNFPPVANGDRADTMMNTPVSLNVLENDTDGDFDDLDIAGINQAPAHGSLTTNFETGAVTYTPATDYTGGDTFKYLVTDGFPGGISEAEVFIMIGGGFIRLDGDPLPNSSPTAGFTTDDLSMLKGAAARRWIDAGADASEVQNRLEGVSIHILDLPGDALAWSASGILVVDINGAGHDWFIDDTPYSDDEFALITAQTERQALTGSRAYDRVDLLTVLMHEVGHFLGLEHSDIRHNVMYDRLPTGTRRFPSPEDVDLAILNGLGEEDDPKRFWR